MKKWIFAIISYLFISSASLHAEDWPKWMGPRGDNISHETGLVDAWPESGPKQLWSKQVGAGHSSPIAASGKVYIFASGDGVDTLHCLDAKTGEAAWSQSYDRKYQAQYKGARATPTIDGDRIYTLGEAGDLTCRAIANGKEIWRINVLTDNGAKPNQWGAASSPLIVGDNIYVQAGQGGPTAVAINKGDGKTLWTSEARGGAGYAAIVQADVSGGAQLIVFGSDTVYGMNPADGKTLWKQPWKTNYEVNATTPIYRDGQVLITSEYSTAKGTLFNVKPNGLEQVWESSDVKSRFQPVILDDGYIYANSSGSIACVNWKDGKTQWVSKDRELRLGVGGTILRVGKDRLITMSERGKLSLVEATPQGIKLISQASPVEGTTIWASPLLYDGRLYVKGMEDFVCLDLSGK